MPRTRCGAFGLWRLRRTPVPLTAPACSCDAASMKRSVRVPTSRVGHGTNHSNSDDDEGEVRSTRRGAAEQMPWKVADPSLPLPRNKAAGDNGPLTSCWPHIIEEISKGGFLQA